MTTRVCTCGAAYDDVDSDVIGLPETAILERIARSVGVEPAVAVRLVLGITRAAKEDAEALIAYQARELIRVLKRAQERTAAREAAIAAAERRAAGDR